jgi:transcriptional regulator with XRE-family HTH domain
VIDFYKRVEELRNNKGLSKGKFSETFGVKGSNYATFLKSKTINGELSGALSRAFEVNLNWLITGQGSMYGKSIIPLEDENRFMAYYDTFETSVGYTLVKNKYEKVYKDSPIISFIFDESNPIDSMYLMLFQDKKDENLKNMILIKGLEFQNYKRFFIRQLSDVEGYFAHALREKKTANSIIIVKNNLFDDYFPLFNDDYLGLLCSVVVTDVKVVLRALSKNFNYNFNYLLEEVEEYKILVNKINEEESFSDDYQTYNNEEKKEIKTEFDRLEKEYKTLKDFRLEMTREEFSKLTVIGTEL